MEETKASDPQPTPEQIKEHRELMGKFYEENIPFLEKQSKYETLLADIQEARVRRMHMTIQQAQLQGNQPTKSGAETPVRTLKKEEK